MKLHDLDAFTKTEKSYLVKPKNRILDYFCYAFFIFLVYLDCTQRFGHRLKYTYDVVEGIVDKFNINLNMIVMDNCDNLGIFIDDVSNDRLYVNELVDVEPIDSLEDDGRTWCKISGQFDTNRVRGRLAIIPIGALGSSFQQPTMNTSHIIRELSFGPFYPSRIDPLDYTMKVFDEPTPIAYFLSIFPTKLHAMGMELETNQYSVRKVSKRASGMNDILTPAIYFDYDFEPIKVNIYNNTLSFLQWICRLVNILGGVYFVAKLTGKAFKRRYLAAPADQKVGLLG